MGFQTLFGISDAIYESLRNSDGDLAKYSQHYDNITEAIKNTPMLQIYWQNSDNPSSTDRSTFGGGMRISDTEFYVDLYLDQRAHVDKIFKQMYPLFDSIEKVFNAQNQKPYFGLETIKSFSWRADRATFEYGGIGNQVWQYPGIRYTLDIRVF